MAKWRTSVRSIASVDDVGHLISSDVQDGVQPQQGFSDGFMAALDEYGNILTEERDANTRVRNYRCLNQVDWDKVRALLPYERTKESFQRRMELWNKIDVNGNGHCSFSELCMGMSDLFSPENIGTEKMSEEEQILDIKAPALKAFTIAKNYSGDQSGTAADFVQKNEFRVYLEYLHKYYQLFCMFLELDENFDDRVSPAEFRAALPKLKAWGLDLKEDYITATFREMDSDNTGMILFEEFAQWAINMGLDIGGEDSESSSEDNGEVGKWRKFRRAATIRVTKRRNSSRIRMHTTEEQQANAAVTRMQELVEEMRQEFESLGKAQLLEESQVDDLGPDEEEDDEDEIDDLNVAGAGESEAKIEKEEALPELFSLGIESALQDLASPYCAADPRIPIVAWNVLELVSHLGIPASDHPKLSRLTMRALSQHHQNEDVQLQGSRFLELLLKRKRDVAASAMPAREIFPILLAATTASDSSIWQETRNMDIWQAVMGAIFRILLASLTAHHGLADRDLARRLGVVEKAWLGLQVLTNDDSAEVPTSRTIQEARPHQETQDPSNSKTLQKIRSFSEAQPELQLHKPFKKPTRDDFWCVLSNTLYVLLDLVVVPYLASSQKQTYRRILLWIEERYPGDLEARARELRLRCFPEDKCLGFQGELDWNRRWEAEEKEDRYPRCMERYIRFLGNKLGVDWRKNFKTIDYNGSGTMSNSEHEDYLKKIGYTWPQDADEIFYFIDDECVAHGHLNIRHYDGVLTEAMTYLKLNIKAAKGKKAAKKRAKSKPKRR